MSNTTTIITGGCLLALALFGCGDDSSATTAADGSSTGMATETPPSTGDSTAQPGTTGDTESTGDTTEGGEAELSGSCEGVTLLPRPADTAARGPWPVGARTVDIDGLTVEVWYPAPPGSEAGVDPLVYDIRQELPKSEQSKISDEDNPWQECDCFRDLPLDDAHGPYPVMLFVHGTAGFRSQSLPQMVHWASRGFVVMAANHPGLQLADMLGIACGTGNVPRDLEGDLARMLAAVRGEAPGLEAFGDRLDATRIATSGHSAGGAAVATTGNDAQVVIPMAAGGTEAGSALQSTLVLGAMSDSVVAFTSQLDGYDDSPPRKRLVGIANTGHLAFAQLCSLTNSAGASLLEIAQANDICGAAFAGALFQCDESFVPDADGWEIIDFASSAVLEEILHCEPQASAELGLIQGRYPVVLEFREQL